ncbi:MAG: ankyrin repeat domain-containing protein [Ilumatobacteraceae bacterium]
MTVSAVGDRELLAFMRAISEGDRATATRLLRITPELARARLVTGGTRTAWQDFFLSGCHLQLYSGDTALHVAAAAYDAALARDLVAAGADVRARNRRGAEPLHAAVIGAPGSSSWAPRRQVAVIRYLIEAGADPDATAAGGVTPLLRAVRNRCSAAVRALLDAGADAHRRNDNGSSALDLARITTGRGGTGSPEAKAEQATIIGMLESPAAASEGHRRATR